MRIKRKKGNQKIKNAKSHEFDGHKFRSGLELFCYKSLIGSDITDFKYEEVKFTLLEKFEYNQSSFEPFEKKGGIKGFNELSKNIRAITYLPDFTCIKEDKTGWIIETKGFQRGEFSNKWKYFKKYLVDNGYNLTLYLPDTQKNVLLTIEHIKNNYGHNLVKKNMDV